MPFMNIDSCARSEKELKRKKEEVRTAAIQTLRNDIIPFKIWLLVDYFVFLYFSIYSTKLYQALLRNFPPIKSRKKNKKNKKKNKKS
jgi:hypothetical protein